jgi:hypothetical protein
MTDKLATDQVLEARTAAEVGINSQRQIHIALQTMITLGGEATTNDIYIALERQMNGFALSQQGRDTLRSLINREAVKRGFVHPFDAKNPVWRITTEGRAYMSTDVIDVPEAEIKEPEPEGLDTPSFDLGEYPIDSLLIRSESRTVFDVVRRMDKGPFILDPDFQRDFVWDEAKQSKLIESALMRIPLPVFYLAENLDGNVVVVDGLQRLTTFQRFLHNEQMLRGLSGKSHDLNGKYFKDLPPKLQNRIEDTQLILYLIDAKVPDRARLDIFERVNSGVALSRQQMRNCLYVGDATRWLKAQANSAVFLTATGGSLNSKTMRDREAINRFCAFYLAGVDGYRSVSADMDDFLADALKKMNMLGKLTLEQQLTPAFVRSMRNNYAVFNDYAFRRHLSLYDRRSVINIALFDVYSVLLTRYSETFVVAHKGEFYQRFFNLQQNDDFRNAITLGTNELRKVTTRFKLVQDYHADLPSDFEG